MVTNAPAKRVCNKRQDIFRCNKEIQSIKHFTSAGDYGFSSSSALQNRIDLQHIVSGLAFSFARERFLKSADLLSALDDQSLE